MRIRNPFRRSRPLAAGSMPGFIAGTDARYWHERYGPRRTEADGLSVQVSVGSKEQLA